MAEQNPYTPDEARFGDIYKSRFYKDGTAIQLPGDPETPEDFARAQSYLETITNHWLEFGPVWEKQPQDIVEELDYHNAWHHAEVELEQKRHRTAEYREIKLKQLRAVSARRILAMEETGWEVTHDYRVVNHIDTLIEQAVLEQEQLEQLMATSAPGHTIPLEAPGDASDDVPF
jgi:hypothetical protein